MGAIKNDLDIPSGWPRWIIILALFSGAGNGVLSVSQDTGDRYHAATAASDFAIRDARFDAHMRECEKMHSLFNEHLRHSARYTQIIEAQAERMRELERFIRDRLEVK